MNLLARFDFIKLISFVISGLNLIISDFLLPGVIMIFEDFFAGCFLLKFVKIGSETLGGKGGGGRPDFAQAGGVDETKVEEAFKKIKSLILFFL